MMKKVYIKPIMNVVASSPAWLMAGSPTANVTNWNNQLSRDQDSNYWDEDEEAPAKPPKAIW